MKAIFVVDSEGNRVCAKYYDKSYPTLKDQLALEKKLYLKTKNSNARLEGKGRSLYLLAGLRRGLMTSVCCVADVILVENVVSVYRCGSDTTMHVIGSAYEVRMQLMQRETQLLTGLNGLW